MKNALFLALTLALSSTPALAGEWVVSAAAGQSDAHGMDCSSSASLNVDCDDTDTEYKLSLAYFWDAFFGAEVAYYDFGDVTRNDTATDLRIDETYGADGIFYGLTARLPLTDDLALIGRAGRIRYSSDAHIRYDVAGVAGAVSSTDHDSAGLYGLGLRYRLTPEFSLNAEYEQSNDIRVEDIDINGQRFEQAADRRVWNLGASYRF